MLIFFVLVPINLNFCTLPIEIEIQEYFMYFRFNVNCLFVHHAQILSNKVQSKWKSNNKVFYAFSFYHWNTAIGDIVGTDRTCFSKFKHTNTEFKLEWHSIRGMARKQQQTLSKLQPKLHRVFLALFRSFYLSAMQWNPQQIFYSLTQIILRNLSSFHYLIVCHEFTE